jgi:23S rRNA (uridine2552-2'-O)-methyltransferase
MPRSKSSGRWLREHFNDPYVKKAQQQGYRARSAFKLEEILKKTPLIRSGMWIVDLGAAPGGWSQVAVKHCGSRGRLFALDILAMDALADVDCIQGDFTVPEVYEQFCQLITERAAAENRTGERLIDGVLSDIAPNASGNVNIDQPRAMYLSELAFQFACENLKKGGFFICKVFQGEGSDALLQQVRQAFTKVAIRKPDASRARSREVYWVAEGFRLIQKD